MINGILDLKNIYQLSKGSLALKDIRSIGPLPEHPNRKVFFVDLNDRRFIVKADSKEELICEWKRFHNQWDEFLIKNSIYNLKWE